MGHSKWSNPKDHGEHEGYGSPSKRVKRRNIPDKLRECESFDAHSMRGRWVDGNELQELLPFANTEDDSIGGRAFYVVYSYDQAIAAFDPVDGTLHTAERHYSGKTSEHQGNARAWTGRNFRNHNWTFGVQYRIEWEELPRNPHIGELIN